MGALADRLRERVVVDQESQCWLWQGSISPDNGYGRVFVGSKTDGTNRLASVHRVAYEAFVGPIPEGLTIDHVKARGCRHRHCINPEHLEAVTRGENSLRGDGPAAQNARKTHCNQGHPLSGENVRVTQRGHRHCRTCERNWARFYYQAVERGPHNRDKTHCKHGHEFTEENTYRGKNGRRNCRRCNAAGVAAYLARKRAAA